MRACAIAPPPALPCPSPACNPPRTHRSVLAWMGAEPRGDVLPCRNTPSWPDTCGSGRRGARGRHLAPGAGAGAGACWRVPATCSQAGHALRRVERKCVPPATLEPLPQRCTVHARYEAARRTLCNLMHVHAQCTAGQWSARPLPSPTCTNQKQQGRHSHAPRCRCRCRRAPQRRTAPRAGPAGPAQPPPRARTCALARVEREMQQPLTPAEALASLCSN